MKKILLSAAAFAVVAVSAVAVAPTTSEAVPAFARQTGAACLNCHFQAIPRLAAFGRNFRLGGFRDMGDQALIEDDHLSLPAVFNASLMFKARIQNASNAFGSGGKNALEWPDEAAILIGGRYGEHIGGLTEWGTRSQNTLGGLMVNNATGAVSAIPATGIVPVGSTALDNSVGTSAATPLSYKLQFTYDIDAGTVAVNAGSTDGLGASYVFNDPSNTISRNIRGWQHRSGALNATVMNGASTGVGVSAFLNDMVYLALGGVTNAGGPTITNGLGANLSTLGMYFRAAAVTELAGFDSVIGAFYAKASAANVINGTDGTQYGLDVQFQGDLGDMSVGFYMPWILKGENAGKTTDTTGFYPVVNLSFGHAGVRLGYDWSKSKNIASGQSTTTKVTVLGGWYSLAQNVELDLEYNSTKTAAATANATTLVLEYVY